MSKVLDLLRYRWTFAELPRHWTTIWYVASAVLIVAGPLRWVYGDALFDLGARTQLQGWVWGLAFLTFVASLRGSGAENSGAPVWAVPLHAVLPFAGGFAALTLIGAPMSRVVAVASLGIALILACAPAIFRRLVRPGAVVLALAAVPFLITGEDVAEPVPPLVTALHTVSVAEYPSLVDRADFQVGLGEMSAGGALSKLDDGFLLVTGLGSFYRLDWDEEGDLVSRRLPLHAPINQEDRQNDQPVDGFTFPLMTMDVTVSRSEGPPQVYLAHQYWHVDEDCIVLRVSVADLPPETATQSGAEAWRVLYESSPCVPYTYDFQHAGEAGRLAWTDSSTLLLSIGDHAMISEDSTYGVQDRTNPYGKVLQLDTSGAFEVLTLGHRNPQGLSVGRDGSIWSTEHGPQGGDEVNYIVPGENYGWPLATYGIQYGQDEWRFPVGRDHGAYREPALTYVPSVGISNLIHLDEERADEFPKWSSDLLVSSLVGRTLFRLRVRDDRVVYSESIPIGYRIRDLEEAPDGRIVLWTDEGTVLVLSNPGDRTAGELAYGACVVCHGPALEGSPAGPPLVGIVGRDVASGDYDYSPALEAVGGEWTLERLEAFIMNPQDFAPGTSMVYPGLPSASVWDLLQYLRSFDP